MTKATRIVSKEGPDFGLGSSTKIGLPKIYCGCCQRKLQKQADLCHVCVQMNGLRSDYRGRPIRLKDGKLIKLWMDAEEYPDHPEWREAVHVSRVGASFSGLTVASDNAKPKRIRKKFSARLRIVRRFAA